MQSPAGMSVVHRILIPIDFSPGAKHALDYGCKLAARLEVPVVLAYVEPPAITYTADIGWIPPVADPELRAATDNQLGIFAAHARTLGAPAVDRLHLDGDPAYELVRVATLHDCDLIVMGTHGRGGIKRLVLGSVAEQVVRHAPCPVLTVRTS